MKRNSQKVNATTQKFIGIEDIVDEIVLLPGGQACLVIEVMATNFSLQSLEEQEARIFSYASLLNSLSTTIQILIVSRKLDISSYLKLLETESSRARTPSFASHITAYKNFISEIVQKNTVLDKKFYVVLPFSFLEKGASAVANLNDKKSTLTNAKSTLKSKSKILTQELLRVGLKSKVLERNELIHLFYEVFNSEREGVNLADAIHAPIIQSNK